MAPILKEECPQNLLVLSRTQGRKARNLEEWGVDQKERERERERESERTKRETSRFVIVVTRLAAMASAMNIAKRIPLIKFPNRKAGSAGQGQPQGNALLVHDCLVGWILGFHAMWACGWKCRIGNQANGWRLLRDARSMWCPLWFSSWICISTFMCLSTR